MKKAIGKGIFDEIVNRAACCRPAVIYRAGGKPSSRVFQNAREAFEFVYNTLELLKSATFSCAYRCLDNSGAERTKEIEIRFDHAENGACAYSFAGEAPSSYVPKDRDAFADELVYRVFMALAREIHS